MNDPRVSVVIPALNEALNLPYVLPRIPDSVHEVLVVDGHSTDGTLELAKRLRTDVRIVSQPGHGKANALWSGVTASTGDIVVLMDADGSTDPAEIPAFVGALMAGADFAKGSRFLQGGGTEDMTPVRRAGNLALLAVVRTLYGSRYSDFNYGYNAFWRRAAGCLRFDRAEGFQIEAAMTIRALRAGLRVAEVPSYEYSRLHGASHLHALADGWRVLTLIVRERIARGQVR